MMLREPRGDETDEEALQRFGIPEEEKKLEKEILEEEMNVIEKIEEAIDVEMAEIEAGKCVERADSYFMLERFLKSCAWRCWRRGVDTYNKKKRK